MNSRIVLALAILSAACAQRPVETPVEMLVKQPAKAGNLPITLDEARAIHASVLEFLRTTKIEDPVPTPEEPTIEYGGDVRLGAWLLESHPPDLRLTCVISENALVLWRQEILIVRDGARWKPVSTSRVTYHRSD